MGAEVRGEIGIFVLNIAIIQSINEIYTGYSLVHFIPKFSLSKIYFTGLKWTLCCSIILVTVFYIFQSTTLMYVLHMYLISTIIIIHSFNLVVLLGKQKIKHYNLLCFAQPALLLLSLVCFIFLVKIKTFDSYVFSLYISFIPPFIISSALLYFLLKQDVTKAQYDFKSVCTNGFYNQIANLSHTLSNRINFYFLGNAVLVGVFSSATSLIESVWIISSSVSPIVLTHIANSEKNYTNGKITFVLAKICFVLSFLCIIVLLFIPENFFVLLLGSEFLQTKAIMLTLSPGIVIISFSAVIVHYFSALGKQKLILKANVSGLIITVISAPIFIYYFGIFGGCYSAVLSYFVSSFILVISFMKENKLNAASLFKLKNELTFIK